MFGFFFIDSWTLRAEKPSQNCVASAKDFNNTLCNVTARINSSLSSSFNVVIGFLNPHSSNNSIPSMDCWLSSSVLLAASTLNTGNNYVLNYANFLDR